jgi:hypothetical protein
MRTALLAAIKDVEKAKGKSLPELRANGRVKDPLALLNASSKFAPREDSNATASAFSRIVQAAQQSAYNLRTI